MKQVAGKTGWMIYVEPETEHSVSAKFKDLPPGDALALLLGKLNFALVPGTGGKSKLLVFRTTAGAATELVVPPAREGGTNLIRNELIVRVKPGAKIEDIARAVGAKVAGKIDSLNAYRLQFQDAEAAENARDELAYNEGVSAVDSNFSIDRPHEAAPSQRQSLPPPPQLTLKPPPDNGRVIIGLVDTAVPSLGNKLDPFLLKQVYVAGESLAGEDGLPSHGASMTGTMLRSLQEITQGSTAVQILPVDVYGPNPSTSTFDVAAGIVQAVNGGARVVNLSLGSAETSQFLHDTIKEVAKHNVAIFAAAGNEPVTTPFFPAAYPEVTAVTAVDHGQLAPYASRGNYVALAAPGTSVIYYNNQPFYTVGTSAAAAYISGMAAGYMDANNATPAQAQAFLRERFGVKVNPPR